MATARPDLILDQKYMDNLAYDQAAWSQNRNSAILREDPVDLEGTKYKHQQPDQYMTNIQRMLLGRVSKSKKMADAELLANRKSRISDKRLVQSQSVEDLPRHNERSEEAIQFVLAESR